MPGFSCETMCSKIADSAPNEETSAKRSPNASIALSITVSGWACRSSASSRIASDGRSNWSKAIS